MAHIKEKKQFTEIVPEKAQALDLLDKDKSVIINILKELKETISKGLKESIRKICHQRPSVKKKKSLSNCTLEQVEQLTNFKTDQLGLLNIKTKLKK